MTQSGTTSKLHSVVVEMQQKIDRGLRSDWVSVPSSTATISTTAELPRSGAPGKGESQQATGVGSDDQGSTPDLWGNIRESDNTSSTSLDTIGINSTNPTELPTERTARLLVEKLRAAGLNDYAQKIQNCHTKWTAARCKHCGKRYAWPNHCDLRFCPHCQHQLSLKRQRELEWWVIQLRQPKHVVLTVRNTEKLTPDYMRWFKGCLTRLRRRKIAREWQAGIYAIEVTNESRGWHVHCHMLVEAPWIDQRELAKTWAQIVGQDFAIVWVGKADKTTVAKEVMKYVVKGNEMVNWTPEEIRQYIQSIESVRLFGRFGDLHGAEEQWKREVELAESREFMCECGSTEFEYLHDLDYQTAVRIVRGPPESWDMYIQEQQVQDVIELASTF